LNDGSFGSADPCQALNMKFKTKEDAIQFVEQQGYAYIVQEPNLPKWTKKVYADNYLVIFETLIM
jgi:NADH dehydrogenase (ubiquinone) Fe-S protein 4